MVECRAVIKEIMQNLESGGYTLLVETEPTAIKKLVELKDMDCLLTLAKYRKKRSLDANSYYWVLVGRIAEANKSSRPETHNILLGRYGTYDTLEDKPIPWCIRDDIDYLKFEYPHLYPTSKTLSKGGMLYRWYWQIKGSHEYDTKEMSKLIDGAVSEAQELGIETLPPAEIEKMKQKWGIKVAKIHKDVAV